MRDAKQMTLRLLPRLFGANPASLAVRLWDGTTWPDTGPRPVTLALKHPGALRAVLLPGTEVAMGEAYLYDDIDIEGDIEAVFYHADALFQQVSSWRGRWGLARDLLRLPAGPARPAVSRGRARLSGRQHSKERDRQAVTYHYDVSNDFYALFLDRTMTYSCAYFQSPEEDLDSAQTHKLDFICRKLRLKPGQRVLDIGCGWGGLAIYAAQHYGANVLGITLSQPQAELANSRIAAAGLSESARVCVQDYREVEDAQGYDALVSVGMFEHVGQALLPCYFSRAIELLRPGGIFLNHGIGSSMSDLAAVRSSFTNSYVFPDGELVPISTTLTCAEQVGFEVRDVESLREHYALTLRHWVRRLEANHEQALRFVNEATYRVWRLFMSGDAHMFTVGRNTIYQALLVKPEAGGASGLPLTRAEWYV